MDEYDIATNTWKAISLEVQDGAEASFDETRRVLTTAVLEQSKANFDPLINSPIFTASMALEHRTWPISDDDALRLHGIGEVAILIEQFSELKLMEGFDKSEALRQWELL